MSTAKIAVTRTAIIPGTPDQVFRFVAAEDVLPKLLTGYGPLPAVVGTTDNTGPWDSPGSSRLVHLADGTTVHEQVTSYDLPRFFSYRISEFGNPLLSTLAREAYGEWSFAPIPTGTKVSWTYTFIAKNYFAAIPLSAVSRWLLRGYMDVCLKNLARIMSDLALRSP